MCLDLVSNSERMYGGLRGTVRLGNLNTDAWVHRLLLESVLPAQPKSPTALQDLTDFPVDPYSVAALCVADDEVALTVCRGNRVPYFYDCHQELPKTTDSR